MYEKLFKPNILTYSTYELDKKYNFLNIYITSSSPVCVHADFQSVA